MYLGLAHEDGEELLEAGEVHPTLTGRRAAGGGKVQHLQRAQPGHTLLLQDQLHQLKAFCLHTQVFSRQQCSCVIASVLTRPQIKQLVDLYKISKTAA